jgi:effector-binding domain-containing protein
MTELLHPVDGDPRPTDERPSAEPEIRRLPMRETAFVAVDVAPGELPAAIGGALREVEAAMREAGVGLAGPPFARYLAFEPRIRAEVGFPVLRPAPHVGRVEPGRLPGGRIGSIVHIGPYEGLARTYERLHRWLAELGQRPAGPMWEVYWSDPETEPDPATWRTEIFAPVE